MGNPQELRESVKSSTLPQQVVKQGTVTDLVANRDAEYGGAWKRTGEMIGQMLDESMHTPPVFRSVFSFNWIMILNKLARAMVTPNNKDHWLDIAGYATLVVNDLEAKDGET